MEMIKYFFLLIINLCCTSNNTVLGQQPNELSIYINYSLYDAIKKQDCNEFLDSITFYYFTNKIEKSIDDIDKAIDTLYSYKEKNKFIKKRKSDGCISTYYALIALKASKDFINLSNNSRISSLFEVLRKRKINNELIGYESTLLRFLFNKYDTIEEFKKIYKMGNEDEKRLILNIIVSSSNIEKKYLFLNSIDYEKQSRLNQSIITLYKRLSLEELKRRQRTENR